MIDFKRYINIAPLVFSFFKHFCHFFYHTKKAVLCVKVFTESKLSFCEYMIEIFIHLILEAPSMYLRQIRQDTYWTIAFNNVPDFFFKKIGNHICIF